MPEEYIGIISPQDNNNSRLAQLKEFRTLHQKHFDTVLKLDSMAKELSELETKDSIQISYNNAKNFMDSNEFSSQTFDSVNAKFGNNIAPPFLTFITLNNFCNLYANLKILKPTL